MLINRIQARIFGQLCAKKNMEQDEYICSYSEEYLEKRVNCLAELTEEDGDRWITRAYLQSL